MNILIVDDHEENLYLLESLLKGNGHQVFSAPNGKLAFDIVEAGGIDLVITDQILLNLCVNAKDAIEKEGKIDVLTENTRIDERYCCNNPGFLPGEFVVLAVTDNGCGMDAFTREKIFEPFYTTKLPNKGTGLGLSTVYGIVKKNSGFIQVSSEPAAGTTFKIYIPRHAGKTSPD
jgi:two-component system, cell cycle sensor histidine kinase and response regulator CckA